MVLEEPLALPAQAGVGLHSRRRIPAVVLVIGALASHQGPLPRWGWLERGFLAKERGTRLVHESEMVC